MAPSYKFRYANAGVVTMGLGEYQLCPKCNGERYIPHPEGGHASFCIICDGKGIIVRPVIPLGVNWEVYPDTGSTVSKVETFTVW